MALERFVTLVRTRGLVSDSILDAARRSLVESGEDASAFRLASVLVERGAIGETTAQELLAASVAGGREGAAPGAAAGAGARGLEGRVIGNWRVARKLSEGGMGAVYLAEHRELGRRAALKVVLDEHGGDTELLARFENEARVLARVRHPNVVDVIDFGRDGDRRFILMEFVDGKSLSEILEGRGAVPPREAAAWARDAARGLAAIHGAGLVHRDIKPSNILVGDGGVKIVDFGVVRELDRSIGLTLSGLVVGTPLYMSPEQARGKKVDARSDVYALGATLYHLVAGEPPFNADSALGVLMKHINERPPRAPLERKGVPTPLIALILRMLAKEARARPESAAEVADALDAILSTPEKRAGAASAGDRAPPSPTRRRASAPRGSLAGAAAGLAVAVIGVTALVIWLSGGGAPGDSQRVGGPSSARGGSSGRAAPPSARAASEAREGEAESRRLLGLATKKEADGKLLEARALLEAALAARPDPEVQRRLRALDARIAREDAARRAPTSPTTTADPRRKDEPRLFGGDPRGPSAGEGAGGDDPLTPTASAEAADEPPRPVYGGRFGRRKGAPEGAGASFFASLESEEAEALAAQPSHALLERLIADLGPAVPFSPRTSHEEADRALKAVRASMQSQDAKERLDWERLRRDACAQAVTGFAEVLRSAEGDVAVHHRGGKTLPGKLRSVTAREVTVALTGGGEASIALGDMTLEDVVATREHALRTRRAARDERDAAFVPDPGVTEARAFLDLERDALAASESALPRVKDPISRAVYIETASGRELWLAREDLRAGRFEEARRRMDAWRVIAKRAAPGVAAAWERLRASIPRRIARRLELLPEEQARREGKELDALLTSIAEKEPEIARADVPAFERAWDRLFALAPAGTWFYVLPLGGAMEPGRFWTADLPRGSHPGAGSTWSPIPVPPAVLAQCDGVQVLLRRDASNQAGIVLDPGLDGREGVSLYLASTFMGWTEWLDGNKEGRSAQYRFKFVADPTVSLTLTIDPDGLGFHLGNERLAAIQWSPKHIRALSLNVSSGEARVERLALRRAP